MEARGVAHASGAQVAVAPRDGDSFLLRAHIELVHERASLERGSGPGGGSAPISRDGSGAGLARWRARW